MNRTLIRRGLLVAALATVAVFSSPHLQGYTLSGRKWPTDVVHYYVNPESIWISESAATSAVQEAAATWNEQTDANITLLYGGRTSGSSLTLNYKNEVFFRDGSDGSSVASTYYWYNSSNQLLDTDIVFYEGTYKFFAGSGCSGGIYVENVGAHEFGHVLGLRHSSLSGVTMQTNMQGYCDRTQLTLEPDDIAGLEANYPPEGGSPSNTAPSVTVSAPGTSASFAEGASITFSGSAGDSEDGNLTPNLKWTSNLSGQIGTGGNFSKALVAGTHNITASATDSAGATASRQITVTVTAAPAAGGATLRATGSKVKGLQKAALTWSGLSAASVDVYRNGAKVATWANTGSGTDPIDSRGGGSYTYKVCGAGTSTCTNNATVAF
jgi:hypothetical protein